MFTGIVECLGTLLGRRVDAIEVEAAAAFISVLGDGESVCVNGVCLTVRARTHRGFIAELSRETAERTTLGRLPTGARVNLERALPANGRLDGHLVLGHVDTMGRIKELRAQRGGWALVIAYPADYAPYVVDKGCVCVDGISLTPYDVTRASFRCAIVPATYEATNLKRSVVGGAVNLEFDVVAKYVKRRMEHVPPH